MAEVSVVIPAFNRAGTVGRAIASVLRQTWKDFELIVVDDGSSDDTAGVALGIGDPRIRVEGHEANRGAAAARNTGILAARGDYVAFLDSDDEWAAQKLERQLAELRRRPEEGEVCCTGVLFHLLDQDVSRAQPLARSQDWLDRFARGCDVSPGTTLLARRDVFQRVGLLDEALPRFEDWDWMLRYAQHGGVVVVEDVLAVVHNRRGRLGAENERAARYFAAKHDALLRRLGPRTRRASLCDLWMQVCGTYAFQGRYGDALRAAAWAARYRPLHVAQRLASKVLARGGPAPAAGPNG